MAFQIDESRVYPGSLNEVHGCSGRPFWSACTCVSTFAQFPVEIYIIVSHLLVSMAYSMFYLAVKHWNYPDDPFDAGGAM